MAKKPMVARMTGGLCRSPSVTSVAGLPATTPAVLSEMMARKRPMPPVMATRIECGMPLTISSRMRKRVTARNRHPEMKTAPSAALPGEAHAFDDGVGEIGVEAHARCAGDGVIGVEPHDEGGEGGDEAGCDEDGVARHAGVAEDGWIDEDDVGHRQEGGDTGEHLGAQSGAGFIEAEIAFGGFEHREGSGLFHDGCGPHAGGQAKSALQRCVKTSYAGCALLYTAGAAKLAARRNSDYLPGSTCAHGSCRDYRGARGLSADGATHPGHRSAAGKR